MIVECCKFLLMECPTCGRINEYELNYFEFNSQGFLDFSCECGDVNAGLKKYDKYSLLLNVHCVACEKVHIYKLGTERLFKNNSSLSCVEGARICIVGEEEVLNRIRKRSDKKSRTTDELALLMKKLYTLDEEDNILCTCGNSSLVARICSDKLYLRCDECQEESIISLDSREDLRVLLEKDKIVIGRERISFY